MADWWESAPLVSTTTVPMGPGPITVGKPKTEPAPSGYKRNADGSLTPIKGGPADPMRPGGELDPNKPEKDAKSRESELSAAFLASNLTANVNILKNALQADPSAAKPTYGQAAAGIFGDTARNLASPAQRQVVYNAQRLITDAALTLGTGAAYTKEQIDAYQQGFFPQLGDTPEAIAAKRRSLQAALIAARVKAGGSAGKIDEAMAALGMDPNVSLDDLNITAPGVNLPTNQSGTTGGGGGDLPPGVSNLSPEQSAAFEAFMETKPDAAGLSTFLGKLTGKTPTNAQAILDHYRKTGELSGTVEQLDYEARLRQRMEREQKAGIVNDPATTLVTQGGTLNLSDEAAGIGEAASNLLTAPFTGKANPLEAYRFGRDLERMRIADARQQLGYGGAAIEFAGGLASAAPSALGALVNISPRAAAAAGATGGALAGYGSGEGAQQSMTGAALGGATGAALARYGPAAVERVLPRSMRASPQLAPDLAQAADAEGVNLIRPMVDPASRTDFSAMESKAFSQPVIREAVDTTRTQMADATARLGRGGTPLDEEGAAGNIVQEAGRRFIQRSRNVANRLYGRAETLAGNTRFTPNEAVAQVDAELAQLRPNAETNAGEISFLEGLRRDLTTNGGKSVAELRQLRESLRGRVSEGNLTATQAEARAIRVMDAAQQDVARETPRAASAYRRADTYYRERMTHINDIIERITGGTVDSATYVLSGEQAFKRLKSMASPGGDGRRLAALMRDLTPSERQDIAATIATRLGRRSADEPFSADRFITMTNQLSPSARRTIFGPDGAESIQNLRRLSQALKDAGQDINQSRSGTLVERAGFRKAAYSLIAGLSGLGGAGGAATGAGPLAGGATGLAVGMAALGATALRRTLSARAMVNPRVSRWLADGLNVSTRAQAQQAVRRLGTIIAREPALAHELQPIHDALSQRLTGALAAEPGGNDNEQR